MDSIVLGLVITALGALLALVKDWKKKSIKDAKRSNILGIIGFSAVVFGGLMGLKLNLSAVRDKKKSDDTAKALQQKIVQLVSQSNHSLKSQLDTAITILSYSKKLDSAQSKFSRLQTEDSHLQSQLYSEVIGGNKMDNSFAISIIVNQKNFLPVIVNYDDYIKTSRLMRYNVLSTPMAEKNGQKVHIGTPPRNYQESERSLAQMIQYKLISDIMDIQTGGLLVMAGGSFSSTGNKTTVLARTSSFSFPHTFKLSNPESIKGKDILSLFSNRIFSQVVDEKRRFKYIPLILPKGTKVLLDSLIDKNSKVVTYQIKLVNSHIFNLAFNIQSLGSSSPIASDLGIAPDVAQTCLNYYYKINLIGTFYNLKAGIPETAEYKKWTNWLFEQLKEINYGE